MKVVPESPIFVILCLLCFESQPFFTFILSTVVVLCHVAAVKRGKTVINYIMIKNLHHHSAGYILFPFGSLSPSWLF